MKSLFKTLLVVYSIYLNAYAQINTSSFAAASGLVLPANGTINVTSGDIDGDGKNDLITVNEVNGVLSIIKNTSTFGNVSFATRIDSVASNNVTSIQLVDLDGDGKLDIVASTTINNSVVVYRNLSTPGNVLLGAKQTFAVGGTNAWGLSFGDLDGDDKTDIVTSNAGGGSFSVLRNTSVLGAINFGSFISVSSASIANPLQVIVADIDNDTKRDVILFNNSGNNILIYKNTTTSVGAISISTIPIALAANSGSHRGDVADVDGDGKLDITCSNYSSNNSSIFRNLSVSGNIAFASKVDFSAPNNVSSTLLKDIDNDGKPELIQSYGSGASSRIGVYRNFSSTGSITTSSFGSRVDFLVGNEPRSLTVFDIDNDSKVDIVTANFYGSNLSILKNIGIQSNGLVAHYPFNGNAGDSSGFGNHGTLGIGSDAPILTADRLGNPNSAYYFDGTTDIINVNPHISLRPNRSVSIAVWIKSEVKTANTWNFILTYRYGTTQPFDSYKISTNPIYNNNWTFGIANESTGNQVELINKFPKQDNVWMHIATVFDGATMKIYTNGVLDTTLITSISNIAYSSGVLAIGNSLTTAIHSFKGAMDDLRIYNRALSSTEIRTLAGLSSQTFYYSKSTGSINQLGTWGTNPDGSGTSPLSFDSSNTIYNIVNGNTSLTGNFKVNGTNSVVVFGDGTSAFNFMVAATDTIMADSVYLNNQGTLSVSGTLLTNKFNAGTSAMVQYLGSNPQSIAGGLYENMAVAGSIKSMLGNVTIRGVLGMASSINCNTYELTLGTSTTTRGTLNRSNGSVIGKFSRWYTNVVNTGNTGLFPIGYSTKYTPMQIDFTTAPSTGGKLTCEFVVGNPGNIGLPLFDLSNGFVFIDKTAIEGVVRYTSTGISGGVFTATHTANNYAGVNNYLNLRMIYRNTGGSWTLAGNAGTNIGSNTAAVISRTGLTNLFGEFGVSGEVSENPLPVRLTMLQAKLTNDNNTQLKWQTAFEYNSAKFVVQRSTDKLKWSTRGEVKSQGNSSTNTNYQFNDDVSGLNNTVYYRLVQVDSDGTNTTSKTVSVVLTKAVQASLQVYPNPATEKLTVTGLNGKAIVYDITGKQQLEITADGEVNIAHLPAGIYFLRSANETVKIVKH